jgi:hypothetical protein
MGPGPRIEPRGANLWYVAVLAVLAGALRIPMWLSRTHLTFDEGVFLASTDLAAAGFTQYRDFFASQGPLFFPLLQLGDLLGFGDPRGARTIMVISGIAIAIATYFILLVTTSRRRAFLLSALVAMSGAVLMAAGPVQSDGPALAFTLAALAITLHRSDRPGALLAGVLIGAAIAVKSLHVVPTVLMVAIVLGYRRDWLNLAYTSLTALAISLGVSLVYGVERVWDQYVLFHLAKDNSANLLDNVGHAGTFLFEFDLALLFLAAVTVVLLGRSEGRPKLHVFDLPPWLPGAWMVTSLVVIIGFTHIDDGFVRVVAFLIPPLAMLIARHLHVRDRILAGVVAIAVLFQVVTVVPAPEPDPFSIALVERLELLDEEALVVSDDPGLLWSARRLSHPVTVDPSFPRFATGYLTQDMIDRALNDPLTCAYVAASGRFENTGITPPGLYQPTAVAGFYLRDGC